MKHRITTLLLAFAVAVSGAVFVAAPSASADGLDNPSGTLTLSCPGAKAFIQVDWETVDRVDVRWYLEDTGTATNISPVLRIQARDPRFRQRPHRPTDLRLARTNTSPDKQYAMRIPTSELKVGDLLFYTNTIESTSYITHVAFWEGPDTRFDAISSGVGYHVNSSWWDSRFVAAYRVLGVATVDNG